MITIGIPKDTNQRDTQNRERSKEGGEYKRIVIKMLAKRRNLKI